MLLLSFVGVDGFDRVQNDVSYRKFIKKQKHLGTEDTEVTLFINI